MDARTVATILLKVFGLVIFANAVFDIPSYSLGPFDGSVPIPLDQRLAQAATALLLPIVFGLLLWFFPGTVTNRIVSGARSDNAFGAREFERVALTVLGAWLVTYGAIEIVSNLLSFYFTARDHPGLPMPARAFAGAIATLFEILIGLFLVFGTPGLQRLIERVREI